LKPPKNERTRAYAPPFLPSGASGAGGRCKAQKEKGKQVSRGRGRRLRVHGQDDRGQLWAKEIAKKKTDVASTCNRGVRGNEQKKGEEQRADESRTPPAHSRLAKKGKPTSF